MTESTISDSDELFKKMVMVSAILHISILIIMALKAFIFPSSNLDLTAAIQVDMVALPDKTASLPEAITHPVEKPVEKIKPVEEPKPIVVLKKNNKNASLEKIKQLQKEEERHKALEDIQKQVREEEARERASKAKELLKGNAISKGSALHGIAKVDYNEYIGQVQNHIHEHWSLPEWLRNDSLKAQVRVYIDFRGVVIKRTLEEDSGDSRYDGYALKAVDDASPFPKPPDRLADLLKNEGVTITFP